MLINFYTANIIHFSIRVNTLTQKNDKKGYFLTLFYNSSPKTRKKNGQSSRTNRLTKKPNNNTMKNIYYFMLYLFFAHAPRYPQATAN